jgi:peroxiredoxin
MNQPTRRALLAAAATALALPAGAAVTANAPAPDFTLKSLAGANLRLAEQRGRVVLINFWASWCAPCRQEMPHLNALHERYRSAGLVLLGVNVDDDARNGSEAARKLAVGFPVLLDTDKRVSRLYDMSAMPATVLLDRDGRVRHLHRGYREGMETLYDAQVRALLKE